MGIWGGGDLMNESKNGLNNIKCKWTLKKNNAKQTVCKGGSVKDGS